MRIVQIIPTLAIGGAERFVVDLCNEIAKANEIILIVFGINEKVPNLKAELSEHVQLLVLDKKKGFDFNLIFQLFFILKSLKADVIHTHLRAINYILFSSIFFQKIKFFHTVHSMPSMECSGIQKWIRFLFYKMKIIFPITISKQVDIEFEKMYNVKERALIQNGRNVAKKSKNFSMVELEVGHLRDKFNNPIILVNIANVKKNKNQEFLIRASKDLKERGYNVFIFIIGSMVEDSEYFNFLTQEFDERILFKGQLNNACDYLYLADAFVLCSLMEGAPISLQEAMSIGVIPICTPAGGIKDVLVDDFNGFMSKDMEYSSFLESIVHFLDSNELKNQKMRGAALKTYQDSFLMEKCSQSYISLFNSKFNEVSN